MDPNCVINTCYENISHSAQRVTEQETDTETSQINWVVSCPGRALRSMLWLSYQTDHDWLSSKRHAVGKGEGWIPKPD